MRVSVILSVYNEEKYINRAIESILNQTLLDLELIIINDGSTDKTLDIINSYDDDRIRIVNQENMGLGASRNKGLKLAEGEYVAFLDGDDWFDVNALDELYDKAVLNDCDIVMFQMINYDEDTGRLYENDWFNLNSFDESFDNKVFSSKDTKNFLFDLSVSACQKLYKASFVEKSNIKFPEGIYFEDMPFFFEIYLKADRISLVRKHFYYRRKHSQSITHVVDCNYLDTVPAGKELIKRFIENGFYEEYKFDLLAYKINGPRIALGEIVDKCKKPLFELIHEDYLEIKDSSYYNDYLTQLGPVKRKFFLDVINADSYEDFLEFQN